MVHFWVPIIIRGLIYNTVPNTGPTLGDPKRDHNFDNHPYVEQRRPELQPNVLLPKPQT